MNIYLWLFDRKLNIGIIMSEVTQFYPAYLFLDHFCLLPLPVTIVNFQYILFVLFIK